MTLSHVIKGGEDQVGQVGRFGTMDHVAVKLVQDLAPIDEGNGEKQVRSRSMNRQGHVMI